MLMLSANAFAQRVNVKDVPEPVKSKFNSVYPDVKKVTWDMEDGNYEAGFTQNKTKKSVVFDKEGNLLETETRLSVSSLPESVLNSVKADYPKNKIREAAKFESNGTITYEAEIKNGGKSWDLIYSEDGKLLKKIEDK